MSNNKFYTLTSATTAADELLFARLGANDPEFNLRRDPAFIIRRYGTGSTVFVTVIEPHGSYSPVSELATNSTGSIATLHVAHDDENYTAIAIEDREGHTSLFVLSNRDAGAASAHRIVIGGNTIEWTGPYYYSN